MLPLLAVGAIAFGLMAQRKSPADSPRNKQGVRRVFALLNE
jgi:hypothetical protein